MNLVMSKHFANTQFAMKSSWHQDCRSPLPDFTVSEANFICHADGGTREESCSAAGCFLDAMVTRSDLRCTFPVAMHGQFFEESISPFLVETVALEEAIAFVLKFTSKS